MTTTTATCMSPWWAGFTCDHLYEDCPNRVRAEKNMRRYGEWFISGPAINAHGRDVCGLCLNRHNRKAHS